MSGATVPAEVTYTATVRVSGGRGGTARSLTGTLRVDLTRPAQRGPDAPGTDPEELFAAGYAACFDSALAVAARQEGVRTGSTSVTASVSLRPTGDGRYAIAVALAVSAPDCPQGDLERAVAAADRLCPYSNALRGNTAVTIRADGHQ
ncbi:peroxiredoxin, Ohr subfamily [Micromonospora pallida]|uniref:Peroxiredoxin, Ohr subfamily n=1 Tax=Micromonospora pallida TaxID=145854 RepID=A0A1C6RV29_9ACTN|nr:Ohr family peroxiredoxin [Micromonospora pallida]SCL20870.1 peroxiredoxin, Ohr subfamily [Micromonospora pallida]